MSCIIFDGKTFAAEKEVALRQQVDALHVAGKTVRVKTFTFAEDEASRLYTSLKKKAADRIGILYEPVQCSLSDSTSDLIEQIRELSYIQSVTGIMVQKPAKSVWASYTHEPADNFEHWWESLTSVIDPQKDVDCLAASNLNAVYSKNAQLITANLLLPATVKAVLSILQFAKNHLDATNEEWKAKSVLVVGRSDIVGKPLTHVLRQQGHVVVNLGKKEFSAFDFPSSKFDIAISATGQENIINGSMINDGAVLIDVGSPKPEVEVFSVEPKAAFLTPVPGGVGPVTVVSLMENILAVSRGV